MGVTIKEVKKALGLNNADIAKMFGYKNEHSYYQAARRPAIEAGIVELYINILSQQRN